MHHALEEQTAHLARLATTIRTGLDEAESSIPPINEQFHLLAELGVSQFQIEGPSVYCRPSDVSSATTDDFVVYQAAIVLPGGVGAVVWDAGEYHEHVNRPLGQPADLAPLFVSYGECPAIVRAQLVVHVGPLLECLMRDVRLLGA